MTWGGTIGFTCIATGVFAGGISVLWLLSVGQDEARADGAWGDFPHLPDELRPVRHDGRGGRPSEADGPVQGDGIARHLEEGL